MTIIRTRLLSSRIMRFEEKKLEVIIGPGKTERFMSSQIILQTFADDYR